MQSELKISEKISSNSKTFEISENRFLKFSRGCASQRIRRQKTVMLLVLFVQIFNMLYTYVCTSVFEIFPSESFHK